MAKRTVRSLRDRKNPKKRYLEKKRLKRLDREELQWLKCILRDGHFFKQTPIHSIHGVPVLVAGQLNYELKCRSCGFVKRVENVTGDSNEIPIKVDNMNQLKEMKMRQFGISIGIGEMTRHSKPKFTPEEKVEKWKLKTKGFKR